MRSLSGPSTKSLIQSWINIMFIKVKTNIPLTHPEERVHKVHQELKDPVQRPQTADVHVNAAKMIDL